jgi:hypothetical protein
MEVAEDNAAAAKPTSVAAISTTTDSIANRKLSYRGLVRVLVEQCHRAHRDYQRAAVQCLMDLAVAFPQFNVLEMTQDTLIKMAGGLELVSGEGEREGKWTMCCGRGRWRRWGLRSLPVLL